MRVIDLTYLANEIAYSVEGARNALGAIQDVRTFNRSRRDLDLQHEGVFAFLAFHPKTDAAVADALSDTSFGDDAGRQILLLFLAQHPEAKMLFEMTRETTQFGVDLDLKLHPAYELAQSIYGESSVPPFPGLILFDRLSEMGGALYVPLPRETSAIAERCRVTFSATRACLVTSDEGGTIIDFDMLMARLTLLGIGFRSSEGVGPKAAGLIVGAWVLKNAANLVAALPKALEAIAKGKSLIGIGSPPPKV